MMPSLSRSTDIENDAASPDYAHLTNETLHDFSWSNVTVTVKKKRSEQTDDILSGVNGIVEAGMPFTHLGRRVPKV